MWDRSIFASASLPDPQPLPGPLQGRAALLTGGRLGGLLLLGGRQLASAAPRPDVCSSSRRACSTASLSNASSAFSVRCRSWAIAAARQAVPALAQPPLDLPMPPADSRRLQALAAHLLQLRVQLAAARLPGRTSAAHARRSPRGRAPPGCGPAGAPWTPARNPGQLLAEVDVSLAAISACWLSGLSERRISASRSLRCSRLVSVDWILRSARSLRRRCFPRRRHPR